MAEASHNSRYKLSAKLATTLRGAMIPWQHLIYSADMATIVITSYGTLGDTLPFIALGQALKAKGHWVRLAVSDPMWGYVQKAGLEAMSNGLAPLGKQEAQQHSQAWNYFAGEQLDMVESRICDVVWTHLCDSVPQILVACEEADLLISSPQQDIVAAIVAEKLGICWVSASVTPSLYCWERKSSQNAQIREQVDEVIQTMRLSLGLSELSKECWQQYHQCDRLMLASSPHFSQPTSEFAHAFQTGFWFYEDPAWKHWQPSSELREFIEQDPQPLVLSFSSQPLEEARTVVEMHVRAALQLGRRILIQQGWAEFKPAYLPSECDQTQVKFVGFMPQDWLFARAAALIHHGGIGTTARAIRNGCPMLVEPYGNDQFFNARQIVSLGIGAAMHPMRLTVEELAGVLQEKVLTSEYKERTIELGTQIQQEQGLEVACNWIKSWC